MEQVIIPFQVSRGMVVPGSFTDEEDESIYYWIRRFVGEEERERLYAAVYESDEWKTELSPKVGEVLDRTKEPRDVHEPTSRAGALQRR